MKATRQQRDFALSEIENIKERCTATVKEQEAMDMIIYSWSCNEHISSDHFAVLQNITDRKANADADYSLLEATADIAYIAGEKQHYSGNSREDIATFIEWAKEFEELHHGEVWGEGIEDYPDAIRNFAIDKLNRANEASAEVAFFKNHPELNP